MSATVRADQPRIVRESALTRRARKDDRKRVETLRHNVLRRVDDVLGRAIDNALNH